MYIIKNKIRSNLENNKISEQLDYIYNKIVLTCYNLRSVILFLISFSLFIIYNYII